MLHDSIQPSGQHTGNARVNFLHLPPWVPSAGPDSAGVAPRSLRAWVSTPGQLCDAVPTLGPLSTDQHTQQQEPTLDFADNTRLQSHSGRYRRHIVSLSDLILPTS